MRPWLALLCACHTTGFERTRPSVPLDLAIVPPEGVTLDEATLSVEGLVLDTCDGMLVLAVDTVLDGLAPSDDPAALLPGGWCGLHLVLPADAPTLSLEGTSDGEPFSARPALESVVVLGPFFADERPLLLVLRLTSLGDPHEPLVAELWVDEDADGALGDADERLR